MNRAILTLCTLAALSLAACGDGDQSRAGAPGEQPVDTMQATDQDAGAPETVEAVPGAEDGVAAVPGADEPLPPPTGNPGGGRKMSYETCMMQARQAGPPLQEQVEGACRRLPDAPKQ